MSDFSVVVRVLHRARRLLRDVGWTKRQVARMADGSPCDFMSPAATCFCAGGAIFRAVEELGLSLEVDEPDAMWAMEDQINKRTGCGRDMAIWNDHEDTRREDVIEMFGHAIIGVLEKGSR